MSTEELRAKVGELMPEARADLAELVSIRSVADPGQFPPEECERAARWMIDAFTKAGLSDLAAHETPDGSKAVFGQAPAPPGAPTVLLYCHYDVQPPLDDDAWETPVFELTEKDGRWFGRGSADCKGNVVMHLTALRALGGEAFPVGIKLIAEGSEEQGTGGLEAFVRNDADRLRADRSSSATRGTPRSASRHSRPRCAASPTSSSRSRRYRARCTPECSAAPHRMHCRR